MKRMRENEGFVLLELLILIVIVGILVIGIGFIGGVCRGNFWVGEKSALKAIQSVEPK